MLTRLREQTGTAGLVIAVVALIAALAGGAYAASSTGGKATASKGKKGPKGAKGATGPAGPAGPAGAVGPQGAAGTNGKDGLNGTNGTNGEDGENGEDGQDGQNGVSVTTEEFAGAKEGHCTVGGSKFTAGATKTYACSGEDGEPWTAGGTLPPGETQTGTWLWNDGAGTAYMSEVYVNISFPIPLAEELDEAHVHYIGENGLESASYNDNTPYPQGGVASTECTGSAENPTAAAGHLCVYAGFYSAYGGSEPKRPHVGSYSIKKPYGFSEGGAGVSGAWFLMEEPSEGSASQYGSFAVTAPVPAP